MLIFTDGFENGTLSAWSSAVTDAGNLSVSTTAKLMGNYGLSALINDNNGLYVQDDRPASETHYLAIFLFDPNTVSMSSGNAFYLFQAYQGTSTVVARIEMRRSAGTYQLRASMLNNAGTWSNTAWTTITDQPRKVQIDWRAATSASAGNGSLSFSINDVASGSITNSANGSRRIDMVRMGAVSGVDTGTRGTIYFDAFQATR